jgi:hypothetical protein
MSIPGPQPWHGGSSPLTGVDGIMDESTSSNQIPIHTQLHSNDSIFQKVNNWAYENRENLKDVGIELALNCGAPAISAISKVGKVVKYSAAIGSRGKQAWGAVKHFFKLTKPAQTVIRSSSVPKFSSIANKPKTTKSIDDIKVETITLTKFEGGQPLSVRQNSTLRHKIDNNVGPGYWNNKNYQIYKGFYKKIEKLSNEIPKEFEPSYASKEGTIGMRFIKDKDNSIRINQAKPDAKFPSQQVDYVQFRYKGNVVDKYGNYIRMDDQTKVIYKVKPGSNERFDVVKDPTIKSTAQHPDAHIPLSDFNKIKEFLNIKK